jgi:hypothetical protein
MFKKSRFIAFVLAVFTASVITAMVSCGGGGGGPGPGTGPGLVPDSGDPGGGGNGTVSNPYRINTKADFMAIGGGTGTNGKYYRLEADLVGADSITQPLGNDSNKRFIGHFDGGGYTINLNITGNHQSAGLFAGIGGGFQTIPSGAGWFNNAGTVKNLKLTGVININGDYAGAVTGGICDIGSFISGIASSVTITVSGPSASCAGGIAGSAGSGQDVPIKIENCYSTGDVSVTNTSNTRVEAGGIAGSFSRATITSCWASGTITASTSSGGIPGYSGGIFGSSNGGTNVSNCVALNPVVSGDSSKTINEVSMGGTFRIGLVGSISPSTLTNSYANSAMTVNGSTVSDGTPNGGNGAGVTLSTTEAADWWKTTAGWADKFGTNEAAPWKWDSASNRPVLWFE